MRPARRWTAPCAALLVLASGAAGARAGTVAVDVTAASGIGEDLVHTYGTNVNDFNDDGHPDLFVVRHFDSFPYLYANDGDGTFTLQPASVFPGSARDDFHDCPWGDVNRDGRQDVYCTVGAASGSGIKANQLWIQQPDGTFTEQAGAYGVRDPFGRGRQATFVDFNHDAYPDLYVSNTYPRTDERRSINRFFVNVDGERFRPAPRAGLNGELGGNTVQAIDFDRDGWQDVLVCTHSDLFLFRNRGGRRFSDVRRRMGAGKSCLVAAFARVNGDARPDLVRLRRAGLFVDIARKRRRGFRRAAVAREGFGNAQQLAMGDTDGDGDAEAYVVRDGPPGDDAPDLLLARRGRRFTSIPIPQYTEGKGDAATAVDADSNGLSDFVVQNGHWLELGPIRMIAFFGAP